MERDDWKNLGLTNLEPSQHDHDKKAKPVADRNNTKSNGPGTSVSPK